MAGTGVNSLSETKAAAYWLRLVCLATLMVVFSTHGLHQCDLPDLRPASVPSASLSAPKVPCLACTVTTTANPIVSFQVGEMLPSSEFARAETAPDIPAALLLLHLGVRAPPQF